MAGRGEAMRGKILGYDPKNNEGAIQGEDGRRYSFLLAEWKSAESPRADVPVDFVPQDGSALQIYPIRDSEAEQNKLVLGIVSLLITFFLGFIGTLISRMAISKIPFSKTLVPVLVHLVITLLALIPVVGWVLYVIGTIYFMVKNYQLVAGKTDAAPSQ